MADSRDGGPAFPSGEYTEALDNASQPMKQPMHPGMSLRDYFAGQALIGLLNQGGYDWKGAAEDAYAMADAMLAAREEVSHG